MSAQTGTWAPLPGHIVDVASTRDALHVAVTRVEGQGGSHGIALATLAHGRWVHRGEIASPTDADIPFGQPVRRRPTEVFTFESNEALWHYTPAGSGWRAASIPLHEGSALWVCPPMALDARGVLVAANVDASSTPLLLTYLRDPSGAVRPQSVCRLPVKVEALAFGGDLLYLGFSSPDPQGAAVWAVRLPQEGDLQPARRLSVPAPADAHHIHVASLDASPRWLLVLQLDAAWILDPSTGTTPRALTLPARDAALRHPRGVLVGERAVVIVGDTFGTFSLQT